MTVIAGNRHGDSALYELTLVIEPAQGSLPVFVGPVFTEGVIDRPFRFDVELQKMDAVTRFKAEGLPVGLEIDEATGTVSGSPETAGVFRANIDASNYYGEGVMAVTFIIQGNPWSYKNGAYLPWPLDVTFGKGRYVVVGQDGMIRTSTDLVNWSSANSQTNADLHRIMFGNEQFIAMGASGAIVTSQNGLIWQNRFSGTNRSLKGIASDGARFVAVGDGVVTVSTNGVDWVPHYLSTTGLATNIAYGSGRFVAVGRYGTIASSADGEYWQISDAGTCSHFNSVAYGNGRFVAAGSEATLRVSEDGIEWTDIAATGLGSSTLSIAYGREEFIMRGAGREVRTSRDGQDWTLRNANTPLEGRIRYVADQYFFLSHEWVRVTGGFWPPRVIAPESLTVARDEQFSLMLEADGTHDRFHAIGLPASLVLDEATGEISGMPEHEGDLEVALYANGEWGPSAVFRMKLSVRAPDETPPGFGPTRALQRNIQPFPICWI